MKNKIKKIKEKKIGNYFLASFISRAAVSGGTPISPNSFIPSDSVMVISFAFRVSASYAVTLSFLIELNKSMKSSSTTFFLPLIGG